MASTQKSFHLRWNNHLQNLQNLFENLYNEQSLVDVTLSCSDGLLYGHKLVLSACSPYFERVLRDNPCKHPIMILKGIRQGDMQKLLEYMYVGAIDVIEDDLEKLLDTATELQIKGLATSQRKNTERRLVPENQLRSKARSPSPKQQKAPEDKRWEVQAVLNDRGPNNNANNDVCDIVRVDPDATEETGGNNEQIKKNQLEKDQQKQASLQNEFNLNIIKEELIDNNSGESSEKGFGPVESVDDSYDEQIDQMENVEMSLDNSDLLKPSEFTGHSVDMPYFCHLCSRGFDKKGSLQRHMLTHAGVKPHNCNFCDLSFLRLSHLQRHIRVHTGERPYACAKCPKQFSRSDKLRQHNILTHNESNIRASKPRGRPRKLVGLDGFSYPFVTQPVVSVPVVKGKRPRGRPRKHPEFYPPAPPPSTSFADVPLNNLYPVTISPIQLNSTI